MKIKKLRLAIQGLGRLLYAIVLTDLGWLLYAIVIAVIIGLSFGYMYTWLLKAFEYLK